MHKFFKMLFVPCSAVLCLSAAHATETTYVGTFFQGTYGGWFPASDNAYSVLAEIGAKNLRLGGTIGWKMDEARRIKLSAEYLTQSINYAFFAGRTTKWVEQAALGVAYRQSFGWKRNPVFTFNGYSSVAPNKRLNTLKGYYPRDGINEPYVPYTDNRRIAGSFAIGINPGIDYLLWTRGVIGVGLNYDYVHYNKRYSGEDNANGLGANAHFDFEVMEHLRLAATGEVRQPFNTASASLNWDNLYLAGRWDIGIFGAYTSGKEGLPSTYNFGLNLNYFADRTVTTTYNGPYAGRNLKAEVDDKNAGPYIETYEDLDFLSWISKPAVYMPQVLAIADDDPQVCKLNVPTFFGLIAPVTASVLGTTIDVGAHFNGTDLTFAMTFTPALEPGDTLSINPNTGVITAISNGGPVHDYIVTVTAGNRCGGAITESNPFAVVMLA